MTPCFLHNACSIVCLLIPCFIQLYEEALGRGLELSDMSRTHEIKAAVVMQDLPTAMERLQAWVELAKMSEIPHEAMDVVVCLAERQGDRAALDSLNELLQRPLGTRAKVCWLCWLCGVCVHCALDRLWRGRARGACSLLQASDTCQQQQQSQLTANWQAIFVLASSVP